MHTSGCHRTHTAVYKHRSSPAGILKAFLAYLGLTNLRFAPFASINTTTTTTSHPSTLRRHHPISISQPPSWNSTDHSARIDTFVCTRSFRCNQRTPFDPGQAGLCPLRPTITLQPLVALERAVLCAATIDSSFRSHP